MTKSNIDAALDFIRKGRLSAEQKCDLAGIAVNHVDDILRQYGIDRASDESVQIEYEARVAAGSIVVPNEHQDDIDEALSALRGGDPQRAVYLLDRIASWSGVCRASAAHDRAGKPACGRLL